MMTPVGITSRWVAASRARETESPGRLFVDPFARALAGDEGFAFLVAADRFKPGPPTTEPDPYLSIRTRFFDDALLGAVRGIPLEQVVLMAAGMDARAYRLDWPDGVTLYEVDRHEVLDYKESVLSDLRAQPRCARRIVPVDLREEWAGRLVDAGFDPARPSALLVEGLLVYLDESEVERLLAELSRLAQPGSWLGTDVVDNSLLDSPYMKPYLDEPDRLGCAWRFGTPEPEQLLARHGWSAAVVMPGESQADYGRWPYPVASRDMLGIPRSYLMTARRIDGASGPTTAP